MGFLDFLTKPRFEAQEGAVTPNATALDEQGLLTNVGPMQQAPVLEEKPSLLSGVWDYLKSPQNLAALGAALKGMDGDSSGVDQAMRIGQQRRQDEANEAQKAQAKADLAKKNAAFKAAYRNGRFDPQVYMAALGDVGDAGEAFSLAAKLAPEGGVDGGYAYTRDPLTGETHWGEQRGQSYAEQQAEERAAALEEYRRQQLEDADERIAISRGREGRLSRGGGGRGSAPVKLPPGFILD